MIGLGDHAPQAFDSVCWFQNSGPCQRWNVPVKFNGGVHQGSILATIYVQNEVIRNHRARCASEYLRSAPSLSGTKRMMRTLPA